MSHWISFPGLGIEAFKVNKKVFPDGLFGININVRWYGVVICLGIILAFLYGSWRAKHKEGIDTDTYLDLALALIPISVVCARIYYVIFYWSEGGFESFYDVIAFWDGGLAIYGGIIGGFLTILIFSKIRKIKVYKLLDAIAPGVMIGQLIGRWGNFFNAEAHGGVTDLPWRMGIASTATGEAIFVHPTFLYESLWNLAGFLIINSIYKRKKFDGQIFYFYIAWYGLGRGFIELLRTDSLMLGSIRVSSALGFICFIIGIVMTVVKFRKHKDASETVNYENQFTVAGAETPSLEETDSIEPKPSETDDNKEEE